MEFVEQAALAAPEQAEVYTKLGELYSKRLWHQLTAALAEFTGAPANRQGDNFVQLYEQFIVKFEGKLNQLEFAKIVNNVALSHADPGVSRCWL